MAKRNQMSEGKKSIIAQLVQEYDINSVCADHIFAYTHKFG